MQINLYIQQLEEYGYDLPHKSRSYAKSLGDGLYELRPGPNRIIYFFHKTGQEYVLLHAFEKTTQKTPKHELEQAKKEMKDYERRN